MALDELGSAVEHHHQVIGQVTVGEQHVAGGHVALGAVPAQHIELGWVQNRGATRLREQQLIAAVAGPASSDPDGPAATAGATFTHAAASDQVVMFPAVPMPGSARPRGPMSSLPLSILPLSILPLSSLPLSSLPLP